MTGETGVRYKLDKSPDFSKPQFLIRSTETLALGLESQQERTEAVN